MFRTLFAALVVCSSIALTPVAAAAEQEVLNGIAAVVNGDVITFSQVRELTGARERALRDSLHGQELINKIKELRIQAINDLIDRQLILQEFKSSKFTIPEYVIDDRIQTIIREEFGGDRQAFVRTLEAQGYTLARFREVEQDKIIVQAMRQRAVKSESVIPPNKIDEYYSQHAAEFGTPEQIKLRMIVLKKDANSSGSKKKMAEEIRQKVADGADFEKLAQMYSEDASTQEAGGDWGWIDRSTLNEQLTKAAFSLKTGKVSPVLDIGDNYYLLYIEARKNATVKPLGEVRDDIDKKLTQEERQEAQKKWLEGLRKKAYIKMYRGPSDSRPSRRAGRSSAMANRTIGITLGDPAGIGPEVIKAALESGQIDPDFSYRVVGEETIATPGEPTAETSRAAWESLEQAAQMGASGEVKAIVTGPIYKAGMQGIGFPYPGQTEFFAGRCGVENFAMLLSGGSLTVALVTAHVPLGQVPGLLKMSEVVRVGELLADFAKLRGAQPVRIAVAGLNPHAGESGKLGREEIEIIGPAIEQLNRSAQASFSGPISPDTVFHRAVEGEFDAVLCMYHDQGLIPLKLHAFHQGVNVTLGLPYVRTSPDHGTAFEIAGKGRARPDSMIAAINLAAELVKRRRR